MTDHAQQIVTRPPLASIVVNNYNYARFLGATIDSALAQTYPAVEVIVVDDGSTDHSREVIAKYGMHIRPVFKPNGGQASAFNAGFAVSQGMLVVFLDSDDVLFPSAVEAAVAIFASDGVAGERPLAKVQWRLWVIDAQGRRRGDTRPAVQPPEGDFGEVVLARGPTSCLSSPTSGNAWSRNFLQWAMPVPEEVPYYRSCADEFLYTLAPVFGRVRTTPEPQGLYRIHGANVYSAKTFEERLRMELDGHQQQCVALSRALNLRGISIDVDQWRRNSWFHRLDLAVRELMRLVPADGSFVLIDDQTWGAAEIFERPRVVPFLERGGQYWGSPPDDQTAIRELERLRGMGTRYLAVSWPAFWWLQEYPLFFGHVERSSRCIIRNERLIVFELDVVDRDPV